MFLNDTFDTRSGRIHGFTEVLTCTEGLPFTCQQHCTYVSIGGRLIKGLLQFKSHGPVKTVELVGPAERNLQYLANGF